MSSNTISEMDPIPAGWPNACHTCCNMYIIPSMQNLYPGYHPRSNTEPYDYNSSQPSDTYMYMHHGQGHQCVGFMMVSWHGSVFCINGHFDGLMKERCNSIANTLELRLSCTNPSICDERNPLVTGGFSHMGSEIQRFDGFFFFYIYILGIQVTVILEWTPEDLVDGESTLVQVMAWCWWPRSLTPYGVTRSQWVKANRVCHFATIYANDELTTSFRIERCIRITSVLQGYLLYQLVQNVEKSYISSLFTFARWYDTSFHMISNETRYLNPHIMYRGFYIITCAQE